MADFQIDTDARLASVTRSVEDEPRHEGPYKAVVVSELYPSPVADVWDALTDAERLARWFLPVTGSLELGGTYQLEGNAGGEVLECEPQERFLVTWVFADNTSWVEVTLTPEGEGTRMRLAHTCHVENPFWDMFGPGATGVGWESGMIGLSLHLASEGAAVDRATFGEWEASPAARPFMLGCAAAWGAADVAGGADPGDAERRSDATGAFYTGEGPGMEAVDLVDPGSSEDGPG